MKMGDVQDQLLRYWLKACPAKNGRYPCRNDMKISDLRSRIANIAILDIQSDPTDYRYRLIGTHLRDFLYHDYTGQKLSDLEGKGPGSEIWKILEQLRNGGSPLYCEVPYVGPKADFQQASSLYLPLATDHKTIDKIMIVSHFERINYDHHSFSFPTSSPKIYTVPTN